MDYLALKILPTALLSLSLAVACFNRWREFPALGAMAAVNVIRSAVYLAGLYTWNPPLSRVSAALMLLASAEVIYRAGLGGWRLVFCAGLGVAGGSVALLAGNHSADPLKSASHVVSGVALAIALMVAFLNSAEPASVGRVGLMLAYVVGAIASSKQHRIGWLPTIATEAVHCAALIGFLAFGVASEVRKGAARPVLL